MPGQVSVLEVVLVTGRPGKQHDFCRFAGLRRECVECLADEPTEWLEPQHAAWPEDLGQQSGDHAAMFKGIAQPQWRLGVISQHPPATVRRSGQFDAVQKEMHSPGCAQSVTGAEESRICLHHLGGQYSRLDRETRSIQIRQDAVHEAGALDQALLERRPLVRRY